MTTPGSLPMETPRVTIPVDCRPCELEVLVEVHRIVSKSMEAAKVYGLLPSVRSEEWMSAPIEVKLATILTLGAAYLVADPERQALEMVRDVSHAFSGGHDWSVPSVSHTELAQRRSEPGPTTVLISDPAAAARWVATGTSEANAA